MTKVLAFSSHFAPGYMAGGVVRSLVNLMQNSSVGHELRLVVGDRDLDGTPYEKVTTDRWGGFGSGLVWYSSARFGLFAQFCRMLRAYPHELIYLNGVFDWRFSLLPLIARRIGFSTAPVLLAPRGELSSGAISLKRWKKRPYLVLHRLLCLGVDVWWHASSSFEASDIVRELGVPANRIVIAPDLATVAAVNRHQDTVEEDGAEARPLNIAFLSRISPKKNLDFALRVLLQVRVPVRFEIYGPREDATYWRECELLIAGLPKAVDARYCGSVDPHRVPDVFSRVDLFFFPTRGENFGHVIAESLSVGTPVLISDQTPWRDLARVGAGWDIPLEDVAKFVAVIESMAGEDVKVRRERRLRAAEFAAERLEDESVLDANRAIFDVPVGNSI